MRNSSGNHERNCSGIGTGGRNRRPRRHIPTRSSARCRRMFFDKHRIWSIACRHDRVQAVGIEQFRVRDQNYSAHVRETYRWFVLNASQLAGFRPRATRHFRLGKRTQNHVRPYSALRVPSSPYRIKMARELAPLKQPSPKGPIRYGDEAVSKGGLKIIIWY